MPEPTPTPPRPWWQGLIPTNWRELVGWLAVMIVSTTLNRYVLPPGQQLPIPDPPTPVFVPPPDGWKPVEEQVVNNGQVYATGRKAPTEDDRQDAFKALAVPRFKNTEAGQVVGAVGDQDALLYRLAFRARGPPIPTRDQGQIGSCVSFGFSAAVEYTMAAQVKIARVRQDLPDSCQEAIYGGSRVEANGGRVPFSGDGSTGAWAAKWLETTGGVLARGKYGSLDLTAYSVSRCRDWGNKGVPNDLEPECKKHKCHCSLVTTTAEAKTALSQGYAIAVCSDVGYAGQSSRDAKGFLKASGTWGHCMAIIAYRADAPGFLILNSWGPDWVKGPKGFGDEPEGSFWAREADVARMLRQEDSFAVANAEGFKRRKIDPADWVVRGPERPAPRGRFANAFPLEFALAP